MSLDGEHFNERHRELRDLLSVAVYGPQGGDTDDCASASGAALLFMRLEQQLSRMGDRVQALEAAQPKAGIDLADAVLAGGDGPAPGTWPDPVAGEGSLVTTALQAYRQSIRDCLVRDNLVARVAARTAMGAAILAVADWLQTCSKPGKSGKDGCGWWVAKQLRQEVEK